MSQVGGSQATVTQEPSSERERSRFQERREYLRNHLGEKGRKHSEESRTLFQAAGWDPLEVRKQDFEGQAVRLTATFSCLGTGKEEKSVGEKRANLRKNRQRQGL